MTFYQELQLSSGGSKELIQKTSDKREKRRHILIYNIKVYLVLIFCFLSVTVYSVILGADNSVAGVVVLLALLVLRQVDFGIKTSHGIGVVCMIFCILAVGPRVSNMVSPGYAFLINAVCILGIMVLGCHNIVMSNQSTFVLGYLLLQGYDVTGHTYILRCIGLAAGMVICAAVFYINHKDRIYKRTFTDLFREFDIYTSRTQWYIRLSLGVSSAMFLASAVHMPRVMWVGIACMSVMLPFAKDSEYRVRRRAPFNILGCAIFLVLYLILPESMYPYIGLIGGIGVGYSAGYAWQTVFNTFGALAIAANMFGLEAALFLRIAANVFGSLYCFVIDRLLQSAGSQLSEWLRTRRISEAS